MFLHPGDFPSKNTGVGCHFLLQGTFQIRDQTDISCVSCTAGRFCTCEPLASLRLSECNSETSVSPERFLVEKRAGWLTCQESLESRCIRRLASQQWTVIRRPPSLPLPLLFSLILAQGLDFHVFGLSLSIVLLPQLYVPSPFWKYCVHVLSHVRVFAILWTVARQASLSLGFSRQDYWSGLLFLPPWDLPDPGIELERPASSVLAGRFFTTGATWEVHDLKILTWPKRSFGFSVTTHGKTQKIFLANQI